MGCGGSKQAAAPAKAPVADYTVSLERSTDDDALGMTVVGEGNTSFKISSLKEEGLVPTYNKTQEATPETQVKAGDIIVAVNDVFGDLDEMKKQLQQKTVALSLKRQPAPEEAPAAEAAAAAEGAPAAEAAAPETAADAPAPAPAADGEPAAEAAATTTEAAAPAAGAGAETEEAASGEQPAATTEAAAPEAEAAAATAAVAEDPTSTTTPTQPVEQATLAAGAAPAGQDDSVMIITEEPQEINAEQTERRVCC